MKMLGNGHIINKQQADGQIDRHKTERHEFQK